MWGLKNHSPFSAERTWVRDKNGAEIWLVAVKGTFVIRPDGTTEIAEEQVPVTRFPVFQGEPGKSSLLYECDLIHAKPTTDAEVLRVGNVLHEDERTALPRCESM